MVIRALKVEDAIRMVLMKETTCYKCKQAINCPCAFDPCNTDGDCLMDY